LVPGDRPRSNDRALLGYWEGDLLLDKHGWAAIRPCSNARHASSS
jgi:hypothetical protein